MNSLFIYFFKMHFLVQFPESDWKQWQPVVPRARFPNSSSNEKEVGFLGETASPTEGKENCMINIHLAMEKKQESMQRPVGTGQNDTWISWKLLLLAKFGPITVTDL